MLKLMVLETVPQVVFAVRVSAHEPAAISSAEGV